MEILTIIFMISVIVLIIFLIRTMNEILRENIAIRRILLRQFGKLSEEELKILDQ